MPPARPEAQKDKRVIIFDSTTLLRVKKAHDSIEIGTGLDLIDSV